MSEVPDYVNGEPQPVPNNGPSMHDLVVEDIQNRKQFGLNKYNSLLQAYNGRNFLQDLYEELQDAIVYTKGALEEQKTVAYLHKVMLRSYVSIFDKCYPEESDGVLVSLQGNVPGWLLTVYKEVLGDRFEYRTD